MITYNISINDELAQIVEEGIKKRKYANRSEFFRDLIRTYYFTQETYTIENISPKEEDYKIIKKREKNAKFIPLKKLL